MFCMKSHDKYAETLSKGELLGILRIKLTFIKQNIISGSIWLTTDWRKSACWSAGNFSSLHLKTINTACFVLHIFVIFLVSWRDLHLGLRRRIIWLTQLWHTKLSSTGPSLNYTVSPRPEAALLMFERGLHLFGKKSSLENPLSYLRHP